ncbi:hypothetical protein JTS98_05145 [Clostridium botulinum]|nr:hypothetical protein [Clostridium botulinum]MCS4525915.1 hypothetical protein [Clostridium botulinum]
MGNVEIKNRFVMAPMRLVDFVQRMVVSMKKELNSGTVCIY